MSSTSRYYLNGNEYGALHVGMLLKAAYSMKSQRSKVESADQPQLSLIIAVP